MLIAFGSEKKAALNGSATKLPTPRGRKNPRGLWAISAHDHVSADIHPMNWKTECLQFHEPWHDGCFAY
jgi:hypothetical protein